MTTIVLRYSDFQVNTLQEHQAILARSQCVWWGWWKKQHETFPSSILLEFRRSLASGPAVIGLVNRAGVYLSAICERIAMSEGRPITSPDQKRTPAYYRADMFPAWFKFIDLQVLDMAAWTERFGPVPVGDETFFADSQGAIEVLDVEPDVGDGYGILHISDMHFGDDFAFAPNGEFFHQVSLEERIAAALPSKPAGVVVSGDLTTRGSNDGLVSARKFLERLSSTLGVSRDRFVIVPGNHDILVNDPDVTHDFENEQHFRTQLLEFYGERVDLERVQQFRGADGITYIFVVLNSSRPRDRQTMDFGYVGRDRSGPVMQRAAENRDMADGSTWLAVVLHHHILPAQQIEYAVPGRPVSLAIDAGELVGMAADLGFDAILHGHEHVPFVGKTSRIAEFGGLARRQVGADRGVLVLASGSTSVKVERLTDEMRYNTFSYYQVSKKEVHIQLYQFTVRVDPQVAPQWDFRIARN